METLIKELDIYKKKLSIKERERLKDNVLDKLSSSKKYIYKK